MQTQDVEIEAETVVVKIEVESVLVTLWQSTVTVDGSVRYTAAFENSPAAAFIKALDFARGANLVRQ
ncbi:MAG TPA: hypothetical protein VHN39_02740 [Phenylobacterium sp.]|jgi:hypothetical protein|nr:hypothetical protein [Phenylobacterium sp.]